MPPKALTRMLPSSESVETSTTSELNWDARSFSSWTMSFLPTSSIIEPQLGYALRYLEMKLQRGLGCSHGLVGIFEVDKT